MCNNIIEKQYKTEEEFLANYDANKYEKPSVTVDMLIFTINKTKVKITEHFQTSLCKFLW